MSLRSINIAPRAFLSFAFIALLVLLLGGFALNRMSLIRGAATDIGNNWLPSISYLGQINENMLRLRILSFRTLVNREPDSLKESDRRTNELVGKLKAAQDKYAPLVSLPEEKALYGKFAVVMEGYLADQTQMLALSQKGDIDALRTHINTRIKADTDQLGDLVNQLVALNKTGSDAALAEAGTQYNQATEGVIGVIVVAALLTIVLALLLTRSIVSPLNRALRAAEEIASGNLTRPISVDGKDEPARLLEALGTMQGSLRNTIQQISGSATQLASAAVELSAVTEEASRGLQRQNDEIEQAATAVNEMTTAVEEVARNAVSTSEASRESSDAAQSGRDRVVQTVDAIQAMSQDVQTTTGLVEGLAERARDIGKVLESLKDDKTEQLSQCQIWQRAVGQRLQRLFERLREDRFFEWNERSDLPHLALTLHEPSPATLINCVEGLEPLSFDLAGRIADLYGCSLDWLISGSGTMFPYPEIGGDYIDFFNNATRDTGCTIKLVRICATGTDENNHPWNDGTLLFFKCTGDGKTITAGYSRRFYLNDRMGGGGHGNLQGFVEFLNKVETVNFAEYNTTLPTGAMEYGNHHPKYFLDLTRCSEATWLYPLQAGISPSHIEWTKHYGYMERMPKRSIA